MLNFDVTKIKWNLFIQNHAYGVKKYILGEETYMPSMGYTDARTKMFSPLCDRYFKPFTGHDVFHKTIKSYAEIKKTVFGSAWVKKEIENLV